MGMIDRREALSLIGSGAILLSGCSINRDYYSREPSLEEQIMTDLSWNNYITTLHMLCKSSDRRSFLGKERIFSRYIRWLSSLAEKQFDERNLHIIAGKRVAIALFGNVYIQQGNVNPIELAHEFGHLTDEHLDYFEYALRKNHRVRAEAISDVFKHYVGLKLIVEGNGEGKWFLFQNRDHRIKNVRDVTFRNAIPALFYAKETIDDILDGNGVYRIAEYLPLLVINEFKETEKVWRFMAKNDEKSVYGKCQEIIDREGGVIKAMENGFDLILKESEEIIKKTEDK